MSITFTPGPHPTSRSTSSTSLHTKRLSSFPSDTPPPSAPAGPIPSATDPERQPLIPPAELGRRRFFYPLSVALALVMVFGLVVGFGGWRLGKGEGGDRWPGGPH